MQLPSINRQQICISFKSRRSALTRQSNVRVRTSSRSLSRPISCRPRRRHESSCDGTSQPSRRRDLRAHLDSVQVEPVALGKHMTQNEISGDTQHSRAQVLCQLRGWSPTRQVSRKLIQNFGKRPFTTLAPCSQGTFLHRIFVVARLHPVIRAIRASPCPASRRNLNIAISHSLQCAPRPINECSRKWTCKRKRCTACSQVKCCVSVLLQGVSHYTCTHWFRKHKLTVPTFDLFFHV